MLSIFMPISACSVILGSLIVTICGLLILFVYRVYLSPLARFPGPVLAAGTYWYEFYYDVWLRGQYTFHIIELHKKYGPIIRVNPFELHIADPALLEEVYAGGNRKRDRSAWFARQFGPTPDILTTQPHELHRMRRSVLAPFFSKSNVRAISDIIDAKVDTLLERFLDAKINGAVLHMNTVYAAVANDIVTQYTFGMNHDRISHPCFDPSFHDLMESGLQTSHLIKQFPWMQRIVMALPTQLLSHLIPTYSSYLDIRQSIENETAKAIRAHHSTKYEKEVLHKTVFTGILNSGLPEYDKTLQRMSADAGNIIVAGTLTTASSLALVTYHLLAQPVSLQKLKLELCEAIPDPSTASTLAVLEALPYLSAVIQEMFRLSYGSSSRLQRSAPEETLIFQDGERTWEIPKGTPVGMTSIQIHHDETIWGGDSHIFRPERFLERPQLQKYLLHFSKGGRKCIGMNLAHAEIFQIIARVFRSYGSEDCRFEDDMGVFQLWETSECDVKCSADLNFPAVHKGSKGVRLRIIA